MKENPIDKKKTAANPHILPYSHHVGSALVRPIDRGRVKGLAVEAMYAHTEMQLDQIRQQIELLARQARHLRERVEVSERIYLAKMNFKPLIGHVYHLYRRPKGEEILSLIAPGEWGKTPPLVFVATVKLLADHTWELLNTGDEWSGHDG